MIQSQSQLWQINYHNAFYHKVKPLAIMLTGTSLAKLDAFEHPMGPQMQVVPSGT
eukprot:NODE_4667_length_456_cov_27.813268_g4026_i0.p2 GENE.NODE_4667_length_456_cov_27.813268_g4026_i0~~NODE_4667_length_456_cov_27.813268_g4026_i0.p2  ORF type:complete len:55 (-),score=1.93 NODE_4667_length_456_cov_27.813268_g4026_i0:253-417(-)